MEVDPEVSWDITEVAAAVEKIAEVVYNMNSLFLIQVREIFTGLCGTLLREIVNALCTLTFSRYWKNPSTETDDGTVIV